MAKYLKRKYNPIDDTDIVEPIKKRVSHSTIKNGFSIGYLLGGYAAGYVGWLGSVLIVPRRPGLISSSSTNPLLEKAVAILITSLPYFFIKSNENKTSYLIGMGSFYIQDLLLSQKNQAV